MTEFAQDRRLTCNRIFRHLMFYSQKGFSGRLDIKAANGVGWSICLNEGKIFWASGGLHPRRRWQRQLHLAVGKNPDLFSFNGNNTKPFWDYLELQQLARHTLSLDQVSSIVQGTLAEVLFDIVQTFELPLAAVAGNRDRPILPVSKLVGFGDGMQVIPVGEMTLKRYYLSPAWIPSTWLLQKETQAAWEQWVCLGLLDASPDIAPVVSDPRRLQGQVSEKAFQNLMTLLDGKQTFRDIALKMKGCKNQFVAGSALAPYIHRGLVGFHAIGDATDNKKQAQSTTDVPMVACIDTARKTHGLLETLAAKVGCSYEAMIDDIEALYELSRPDFPTPALILIAERLNTHSAQTACQILRRVDRLRSVPIVAYSGGRYGLQQIRQALSAGATEYLCGGEFNPENLLALFERYVGANQARSNGRPNPRKPLIARDPGKKVGSARRRPVGITAQGLLPPPNLATARLQAKKETARKPLPRGKHSILQRELSFFLTSAFRSRQAPQAFPELCCTFGRAARRSIVPDIAVFRPERVPREANGDIANTFNIHPDWIVEILSPNQKQTQLIRNILHCIDNGADMGWLIDPEEACVFVYSADCSARILDDPKAILPVPEFARLPRLTVGGMFGWMKV